MGDFGHRIIDSMLRSDFLPARARTRLMRLSGYNVHPTCCIWSGAIFRSKNLNFAQYVFLNIGFFFDGHEHLEISENVRVGQFVRVLTATHNIGPPNQRCLMEVIGGPVHICKGCWIGCNVTILPNITIAEGCVIAAGSVVTRSTIPNGLYAGIPAKLVRLLEGNTSSTGAVHSC